LIASALKNVTTPTDEADLCAIEARHPPFSKAAFDLTCFFLHSSSRSAPSLISAAGESTAGDGGGRFFVDMGTQL